jgi:hypothetical protein
MGLEELYGEQVELIEEDVYRAPSRNTKMVPYFSSIKIEMHVRFWNKIYRPMPTFENTGFLLFHSCVASMIYMYL